ncbi:MAG: Rrf2 family transcriptional regulator [Clostridiales Family XIII bacterium]|jgi:Rrf2 family protein|nr:Rrf2 family transcriptional regulator [Clostridiales Family XIII bacterium]
MIITRELDYAIRVLRSLENGKKKATPDICREEDLPLHFVYRIVKKLDCAGMVDISRGKDGGVLLACDLATLTVHDLMTALDGRVYVNACLQPGYVCEYRRTHNGKCGAHNHMMSLQNDMDNLLRSRSIRELIADD